MLNSVGRISGKGFAHRRLNKRQLGALGANIEDGLVEVDWSRRQLAASLGVSVQYIRLAKGLSPETRANILAGKPAPSFPALMNSSHKPAALPAPKKNGNGFTLVDDKMLLEVARIAGVDRTLAAAIAIEKSPA